MKNVAIILASGTGSRCNLGFPKQFAEVGGKTVLEHTIDKFEEHSLIDEIIIVTNEEYVSKIEGLVRGYKKISQVVKGGETRRESSYNGVSVLCDIEEANVLIHDGVRPMIDMEVITKCVESLSENDAVCVTTSATDTIFVVDEVGVIKDIPQRKNLKCAQTPQCFKLSLIRDAHKKAKKDANCSVTDDCGLILNYTDTDIHTIDGNVDNIKITYQKDLELIK